MLFAEMITPPVADNDNDDLSTTQTGRFAEFMICADLTKRGYYAMHVDAPGFDILLVHKSRSYRVQVKSSSAYRGSKPTWRCRTHTTSARGSEARSRAVNPDDADLIALYHHDFDGALYLPVTSARDRVSISASQVRASSGVDTVATSIEALLRWQTIANG